MRRLLTKADQNLADMVVTRWETADRQRQPRIDAWNKSYEDHEPQYIDKTKVGGPPYVKYPYLHRVTATQVTALLQSMDANGRWLNARPLTQGADQQKRAEAVTEFLETQHRYKSADINMNNRAAEERVAQMGLKYGNAYFMPEFIRGVKWWTFRFNSLSPYDVWLDAYQGRFYILRRVVTLSYLLSMAKGVQGPTERFDPETGETIPVEPKDGGRAMKVVRRLEREIRKGNVAHFGHRIVDRGTSNQFRVNRVEGDQFVDDDDRVNPEDDPFNQPITVLEYYETDPDGMIAKIIPDFGSTDHLVFQSEKNPYGACPIVPFVPHGVDNEYYGHGNSELIGKLQDVMSWALRGQLAMIGATAWPPLLKTRRSNLRNNYLQSLYGRVIEVQDTDRDLKYMPSNIPQGIHMMAQEISKNVADFVTGESDLRRGDAGAAKSATAAAIAETFSNLTDKAVARRWQDTIEQLGHVLIAMARVHVTRTEVIPILGRQTEIFMELSPQHLEGPWTVQYGGNIRGASSAQMIALKMQVVEAFGQSGEANAREFLRDILRLSGESDPDRFMTRKDDVPELRPEEEHLALFKFGQMPQVSPRENLQRHMAAHMEALHEWQAAMDPFDPRLGKLVQHISDTQRFMQPQVAGQGGVQPFLPQQAGQPGQPASFQPAVAGINDQRQGSNGNGAPGSMQTTVPGRRPGSIVSPAGPR